MAKIAVVGCGAMDFVRAALMVDAGRGVHGIATPVNETVVGIIRSRERKILTSPVMP